MTASLRVIAFPFAGGSSLSYAKIARALPAGVSMVTLDPPGHGRRMAQPLLTRVEAMALDLVPNIREETGGSPYILFGHSMGAYLALAMLDCLAQSDMPLPLRLVLSGVAPPDRPQPEKLSALPPPQFLARVAAMGGMPAEVLQEPALVELFGPILRADFEAAESYVDMRRHAWSVPVLVLRGTADRLTAAGPDAWSACLDRPPAILDFPGGHFFLFERAAQVAAAICAGAGGIDAVAGSA
ncbi:thioesterase II family protein [Caenimonas terrae]|uniref:Thioesterase II family protein n=1 Tax=Caenimonas terrae TaxID=696074 RepID=A0ABW0NFP6_9BURK